LCCFWNTASGLGRARGLRGADQAINRSAQEEHQRNCADFLLRSHVQTVADSLLKEKSPLSGVSIFVFQRLRVYAHSSPSELFHFLFRARIVPAAPNCPSGVLALDPNADNSALSNSETALAVVRGARGRDPLVCITCLRKCGAARLTAAKFISHQWLPRNLLHRDWIGNEKSPLRSGGPHPFWGWRYDCFNVEEGWFANHRYSKLQGVGCKLSPLPGSGAACLVASVTGWVSGAGAGCRRKEPPLLALKAEWQILDSRFKIPNCRSRTHKRRSLPPACCLPPTACYSLSTVHYSLSTVLRVPAR